MPSCRLAYAQMQESMKSQPDALGPVGNFVMGSLLLFLCAGSIFFTVGRSFQDDMVPLTPEQMAVLQQ